MTTRVDVEEIEATKSEKFLAFVLAVFVLIGGVWTYVKLDDYVREGVGTPAPTAADRAALERAQDSQRSLLAARRAYGRARGELELRREAYRTALDEGRRAPALRRAYDRAQQELARAELAVTRAEAAARAAQPEATDARRRAAERFDREQRREALVAFALRLPFVAALLGAGLWLLSLLRRRRSRSLPLAFGVIAAATVLALVLAADYVTDYVDPLDLGPLVLSLFGIAVTLAAFAALQRYLARRIPFRRVRRRECPFCGFPAGSGAHCEGCGRRVVADCAACGSARRVGSLHCAACGAP